ncbi:hypothetical protein [uncultured Gammaproteobacteria bacterium]|nr:hypothetical protein [uncultured Gammaproteobacteria bacterium]
MAVPSEHSPPHRWLRNFARVLMRCCDDSPPHRWLRNIF